MSVEGTNYRDDRGNPSKSFEKGDKPSPSILSPSVETNGATTLLYSLEYQPKFKNQSNLRTITNCYSQRFKRESSILTTRSQPKYHANNVSSKNRREYLNNICKKKKKGRKGGAEESDIETRETKLVGYGNSPFFPPSSIIFDSANGHKRRVGSDVRCARDIPCLRVFRAHPLLALRMIYECSYTKRGGGGGRRAPFK